MLHQKLPIAAVRQRMEVDGISADVVDAFFTGGASTDVQDVQDVVVDAPMVRDTSKFVKFLQIGMDASAVRQKMEMAGFNTEAIDTFFCEYMDRPKK